MLIGHYSAALAAKAVKPQLPLWQLFIAAQLVDFLWVGLSLLSIEYFDINVHLLSNPLVLLHQPYSHSLLASAVWALAAAGLLIGLVKMHKQAALLMAAVVASHWLLDLIVHRPDLPIWPGVNVGLALWDLHTVPMLVEMALIAAAGTCLWRTQAKSNPTLSHWYVGLTLLLLLLVATNYFLSPPTHKTSILLSALAVYVVAPVVVWWLERRATQSTALAMAD